MGRAALGRAHLALERVVAVKHLRVRSVGGDLAFRVDAQGVRVLHHLAGDAADQLGRRRRRAHRELQRSLGVTRPAPPPGPGLPRQVQPVEARREATEEPQHIRLQRRRLQLIEPRIALGGVLPQPGGLCVQVAHQEAAAPAGQARLPPLLLLLLLRDGHQRFAAHRGQRLHHVLQVAQLAVRLVLLFVLVVIVRVLARHVALRPQFQTRDEFRGQLVQQLHGLLRRHDVELLRAAGASD